MKKLTTILILLVAIFTLSSCEEDANEPFTISNFTIISVQTMLNDQIQYNSIYNADTTNDILYTSTKSFITSYEVTMFEEADFQTCESSDVLEVRVVTNNGILTISKRCLVMNDEDTVITYVEIDEQLAYTEEQLYDDLKDLF